MEEGKRKREAFLLNDTGGNDEYLIVQKENITDNF